MTKIKEINFLVNKYTQICCGNKKPYIKLAENFNFGNIKPLDRDIFTKNIKYIKPKDLENYNADIAYHGSPFNFDKFDKTKIGTGEGMGKYGNGLYIARKKRIAPYYANLRSADAPIHFGNNKSLKNPSPTVYTLEGLTSMKFKKVSPREAKKITSEQTSFIKENPNIDGLELENGEICVFAKSIEKLKISQRQYVEDFVKQNQGYDFREWTTDKEKLAKLKY